MKKFSEFRANLTYQKAKAYSGVISVILTIIACIYIILSLEEAIILSIMISVPLWICLYMIFFIGIFKGHILADNKDANEAKQRVLLKYNLTKKHYTQVNYIYNEKLDPDMITKLLKPYTFYVRLTQNEEIELIVNDKDENLVYTDTFDNFFYFENHFEIEN